MTGHQYEQFVRAVLVRRVRRFRLSPDKLRSTRASGVQFPGEKEPKHQIDLLYVDENEIAEYTTIIECKYHGSRKVEQGEIEKLAYVKSSLRASKAILVTNCGFTDGADRVAEAEKIALLVITPRISVDEIDKGLSGDDLFQAVDARLQAEPDGYDFDVKRKITPDPSDRSMDLVSALISHPTIRHQTVSFPRDRGVPRVVKQITRDAPNVVRKTMDIFKKK